MPITLPDLKTGRADHEIICRFLNKQVKIRKIFTELINRRKISFVISNLNLRKINQIIRAAVMDLTAMSLFEHDLINQ